MKKSIIVTTISIWALLCASMAYSQMGPGMGGGMMMEGEEMGRMHERGERGYGMGRGMGSGPGYMHGDCFSHLAIADGLDLSKDQAEKLSKMKSHFRKERIKLQAALKIAKIEYGELLSEDKVDMKAVEKKVREIANLKAESMLNSAKASADMRNILTAEQRAKAKELMRDRRQQCGMSGVWQDRGDQ